MMTDILDLDARSGFDPCAKDEIHALLIEADPAESGALARIAERSKQLEMRVTSCASLHEAEDLLKQKRFDVIFVDYWLGAQTSIRFIHETAGRGDPPCVVVTDLDEPDIRRIAFRAGAHAFLSKQGLGPQALESVVLAVLRERWAYAAAA